MNKTDKLSAVLANVTSVGIAGHVRPDGDCAGSTLALYNYICEYYPHIRVKLFLEPIPAVFRFLSRSGEIVSDYPEEEPFDLFFALDCGDSGRLGQAVKYFDTARRTACIDHHVSNQAFADDNYIFPESSSTCELLFELMEEYKITKEIAECLYTGMVHDTGVFQYSCTSAKTMNAAGILMEKGIDYSKIVDDTFYTKTYEQNRILGQTLVDSKRYLDNKVIVGLVTQEQMKTFGVDAKQLDGIVNQLRVTDGVEVALFFYENEDGTYKGSLRVNGNVDVAKIAAEFGGGGHVKAAGFTIAGEFEACLSRVLDVIEAAPGMNLTKVAEGADA